MSLQLKRWKYWIGLKNKTKKSKNELKILLKNSIYDIVHIDI